MDAIGASRFEHRKRETSHSNLLVSCAASAPGFFPKYLRGADATTIIVSFHGRHHNDAFSLGLTVTPNSITIATSAKPAPAPNATSDPNC
jgi:hypothetical protein